MGAAEAVGNSSDSPLQFDAGASFRSFRAIISIGTDGRSGSLLLNRVKLPHALPQPVNAHSPHTRKLSANQPRDKCGVEDSGRLAVYLL